MTAGQSSDDDGVAVVSLCNSASDGDEAESSQPPRKKVKVVPGTPRHFFFKPPKPKPPKPWIHNHSLRGYEHTGSHMHGHDGRVVGICCCACAVLSRSHARQPCLSHIALWAIEHSQVREVHGQGQKNNGWDQVSHPPHALWPTCQDHEALRVWRQSRDGRPHNAQQHDVGPCMCAIGPYVRSPCMARRPVHAQPARHGTVDDGHA